MSRPVLSMLRAQLAGGLAVLLAVGLARAGETQISAQEDASRPFVVKIHADWCGTCTRLEGPLEALRQQEGANARYVVLDVTDREAVSASQAEADRLGIRSFFDRYKGKTGTVGVLDGATRQPVKILRGEMDPAIYSQALTQARAASPS